LLAALRTLLTAEEAWVRTPLTAEEATPPTELKPEEATLPTLLKPFEATLPTELKPDAAEDTTYFGEGRLVMGLQRVGGEFGVCVFACVKKEGWMDG